MDIGFFFEFENTVIQLPVNPEKISVKYKGNNDTKEVIKLGEINLLKDRKLADISFESFLPQEQWFPAIRTNGEFEEPAFYKEFFSNVVNKKKPLRFIVTGLNINMMVSIENFDFYHQAGDHEDAYFSLDLKEYRDYAIRSEVSSSTTSPVYRLFSTTALTATNVTVGCDVTVVGKVYLDADGKYEGQTFTNFKGKVDLIRKEAPYPYHIVSSSGVWLGWVLANSVVIS